MCFLHLHPSCELARGVRRTVSPPPQTLKRGSWRLACPGLLSCCVCYWGSGPGRGRFTVASLFSYKTLLPKPTSERPFALVLILPSRGISGKKDPSPNSGNNVWGGYESLLEGAKTLAYSFSAKKAWERIRSSGEPNRFLLLS